MTAALDEEACGPRGDGEHVCRSAVQASEPSEEDDPRQTGSALARDEAGADDRLRPHVLHVQDVRGAEQCLPEHRPDRRGRLRAVHVHDVRAADGTGRGQRRGGEAQAVHDPTARPIGVVRDDGDAVDGHRTVLFDVSEPLAPSWEHRTEGVVRERRHDSDVVAPRGETTCDRSRYPALHLRRVVLGDDGDAHVRSVRTGHLGTLSYEVSIAIA